MKSPLTLALVVALPVAAAASTLVAFRTSFAAPAAFTVPPILEIDDDTLTEYLEDTATTAQGIRPGIADRGVHLDGSSRASAPQGWAVAGNPFGAPIRDRSITGLRLSTGGYQVADVDLALPMDGTLQFVVGRTYNARQEDDGSHFDSDGPQGRNWQQMAQPEILLFEHATDDDEDVLYLVYGADRFIEFDRVSESSDVFKATNGAGGMVEYLSGDDTYDFHDSVGNVVSFLGFGFGAASGQFWKQTSPDGSTTFVGDSSSASTASGSYDGGGRITTVFDPADRRYSFTYTTLAGTDRLTEVKAQTKTGGTWAGTPTGLATAGKVEYEYYVDADAYGDDGDLKLVTITTPLTDSGVEDVRKKHYRYWEGAFHATTNPGHVHALKYFVDFEGARRYDWDQDSNLDEDYLTASNASLESYASAYFEYTASHRVSEFWANGEWGCAGTGNGTHEFEYETNGSYSDGAGYDTAWMGRTTVKRPDGSYLTSYHDEAYQPLSQVITDADPDNTSPVPERWATKVIRTSAGLVGDIRSAANCAAYAHSTGTISSSSSAGLVTSFVRYGSANIYEGFVQDRTWKEGTQGTAYMSQSFDLGTASASIAGSETLYRAHVMGNYDYDQLTTTSKAGAGVRKRGRDPHYHGSSLARADEEVSFPIVSTTNNGPGGTAGVDETSRQAYRETDGRVTFSKSETGVVSYSEYTDGQLTRSIQDANTTSLTTPSSDYDTSSGIHRETTFTYDAQGRADTATAEDGQVTKRYYSMLADGRLVALTYADFEVSPLKFYGPVRYTVTNHAGKVVVSGSIALSGNSSSSALTAHVDETDADPITAIDLGAIASMTTSHYSETGGTLEETRSYFSIPSAEPGTDGAHYDPTLFGYDDSGRRWRVEEASGTIRRTVYDAIGRSATSWIGTNDSTFAGGSPSGTDDMVKTNQTEYDSGNDDGNGFVTKRTAYVEDSTTDQRVTTLTGDVRGRVVLESRPVAPHAFHKYDNRGRRVASGLFSSTASIAVGGDDPTTETANRLALSETEYDEQGRAWKTIRHKIDPADGSDDDTLEALSWYDAAGRVVKRDGEQLTKTLYDGLGRSTNQFTLASVNDTVYAHADDVEGDIVLEERQTTFDTDSSDVLMQATISRLFSDVTIVPVLSDTLGALDTNADADALKYSAADVEGRIQITAHWYDRFGRRTDTVQYGTYGDATFDRDGLGVPACSDTALRTTFAYNDDGDQETITDARGIDSYREYDAAGRMTKQVSNYDSSVNSGNPSGTDGNRTVKYEFTDGQQTKIIADMPSGTNDQTTTYSYGTMKGATAGDSNIGTGHLLRQVTYPDFASGTDVVTYAYNAQGQRVWTKDQSGNVTETDFDTGGRDEHRRISTLDADFDGAVRRVSMTYTDLGQIELVTQYDNATAGSGSVVDEVKYSFDGWGNTDTFEQDVNSAVGASGSVDDYEVSYAFAKATGGRNTIRRTSTTLPSGNVITYAYLSTSGSHDDDASRLSHIQDGGTRLVEYRYNGIGQVVGTIYKAADVQWLLHDVADLEAFPDLDRFNRVTSSRWTKDLATDVDFYDVDITYDRGSSITLIEDNVHTGFDVSYTMDDTDRLARAQQGTWGGSSIASETEDQTWTLSHTGNWDAVTLDFDGNNVYTGTDEYDDTRSHNDVNELTARDTDSDSTDNYSHVYDEVGNMTDDGESRKYEYDAFGRMRKVRNQSDALIAEYRYNGLGFLISEHTDTDDDGDVDASDKWFHNAYDERWRKVATFRETDSDPKEEFVNHQAGLGGNGGSSYINAVVSRDKDANTAWTSASDGVLGDKIYYCQNWRGDVSAIVKGAGYLQEWAKYSSYGTPFGLPGGDTDSDGDCDSTDVTQIQAWIDAPAYDVRGDIDLDGDVDATDKSLISSYLDGTTAGRGVLSALVSNRRGYAGYTIDANGLWHVRHRVLDSGLGRWLRRDPLGYADGASLAQYVRGNPLALSDWSGLIGLTTAHSPQGGGAIGGGESFPGGEHGCDDLCGDPDTNKDLLGVTTCNSAGLVVTCVCPGNIAASFPGLTPDQLKTITGLVQYHEDQHAKSAVCKETSAGVFEIDQTYRKLKDLKWDSDYADLLPDGNAIGLKEYSELYANQQTVDKAIEMQGTCKTAACCEALNHVIGVAACVAGKTKVGTLGMTGQVFDSSGEPIACSKTRDGIINPAKLQCNDVP